MEGREQHNIDLKEKHIHHAEEEQYMETKLERIAQIAKTNPKERFTSLIHLINKEALMQCHEEMNSRKASGVDEVTKAECSQSDLL